VALTRRELLRWGLMGGAVTALPASALSGCGGGDQFFGPTPTPTVVPPTPTVAPTVTPTPSATFLTPAEEAIVRAATARIVPTDDLPGAVEAGAAQYISRLLSVVPDNADPAGNVFAGGPFSDRNPFPDPSTGMPSNRFPTNDFPHFIPLTRLQLMSWRVQLLGTAAVPGSDFNAAVLGPVIGLRDQYRTGLADIQSKSQQLFAADFVTLTPAQQDQVLAAIDPGFYDLITNHTLEGMFCAPEYGGNIGRVGWQLIGYDGDSQPLGYSIFDETAMTYRERADKPNSGPNPDEDFAGVDEATQQFLCRIVRLTGGPFFPRC